MFDGPLKSKNQQLYSKKMSKFKDIWKIFTKVLREELSRIKSILWHNFSKKSCLNCSLISISYRVHLNFQPFDEIVVLQNDDLFFLKLWKTG